MKNILKEEINQIQYLFGYKRGVVISEQTDPIKRKIELSYEKGYADTAYYYTLLQSKAETEANEFKKSPDFNNEHFTEIEKLYSDENPSLPKAETPELPKIKTESNMPLLGNLVGDDLTSAYNVLIGYFSGSKDFDGMSAFTTLLHNREKQISMIDLQKYLDKHASINLESVYASITDTDKPTFEQKGKNISPK